MFRKVGVVSRLDMPAAVKVAREIASFIKGRGLEAVLEADLAERLGKKGLPLSRMKVDLAVTVGGDGTVLRTVHGLKQKPPLFAVNMGRVAFFSDTYPKDAFNALGKVLDGKAARETCFMLSSNLDTEEALNEVRIGTEMLSQMIEVSVYVDGLKIAHDRVDAIVVATSTGASAYALSAGAGIVDPRIEAIVIAPVCPLSSNFKPYIVPSDAEVAITTESKQRCTVLIDGQVLRRLPRPRKIKIRKSRSLVVFFRTGQNFYERLRRRLKASSVDF